MGSFSRKILAQTGLEAVLVKITDSLNLKNTKMIHTLLLAATMLPTDMDIFQPIVVSRPDQATVTTIGSTMRLEPYKAEI